jgi:hypothetical protein
LIWPVIDAGRKRRKPMNDEEKSDPIDTDIGPDRRSRLKIALSWLIAEAIDLAVDKMGNWQKGPYIKQEKAIDKWVNRFVDLLLDTDTDGDTDADTVVKCYSDTKSEIKISGWDDESGDPPGTTKTVIKNIEPKKGKDYSTLSDFDTDTDADTDADADTDPDKYGYLIEQNQRCSECLVETQTTRHGLCRSCFNAKRRSDDENDTRHES